MSVPVDPVVDTVVRAAVGHGLDGGRPWPDVTLSPAQFSSVYGIGARHRLLGVLAEAVADGSFQLLPAQRAQIVKGHRGSQVHMLHLERTLLAAAAAFGAAGIDVRVLKGVALAHLVYADPTWRIAGDIDLLIPSDHFDDAVTIAVDQLGGEQPVPELRPGFEAEFGREATVRIGRLELDLHRTFVTGPFGLRADLDELFEERTEFDLGGRTLSALGVEHQFLHACYNTALGDYPVRLCAVRDLLLCRERLAADLDRVEATARRWGVTAVVKRAAELVIDEAGIDVAGGFTELARLPTSRRDQWLLRSYLTPARSYSRPLASLAVIPGVRPRLRYLRAISSPSPEYLRSRGWTRRSHLQRAVYGLRSHG